MGAILFFILAVTVVAGVGVGLIYFTRGSMGANLTKTEFVIGLLIASLVVIPATSFIGAKMARANAATYVEYWSGLEKTADMDTINCTKDGPCIHEYSCDPYVVMVTKTRQVPDGVTTTTHTRSDGTTYTTSTPKYRTETYQEPETRYHDCPYVQTEYSFTVEDTMGESYSFGSHLFPENAEDQRWTGYGYERRSLPGVERGIPADWQAVKDRLDAGTPGGTTKREKYKNYILASSEDIYEKNSTAIDGYLKDKAMPKVANTITDPYSANKVYFVGANPSNAKDWQFALQRMNGYLGGERQGDAHVVLVDTSVVSEGEADQYNQALNAYWQSEALGKDTFSKNGVAIVLGISGTEVEWARGFTGMPMGNEGLVQAMNNLKGSVATPEALLDPKTGAVSTLLLDPEAGFTRVEMKNYEYLYDSVDIGTGARIFIFFIGILISMMIWGAMMAVDLRFHPIENFREYFRKSTDKLDDVMVDEDESMEDYIKRYSDPNYKSGNRY